jgi:hypothetical protein
MTNIIDKTDGYSGKETDARVGTAVSFLKGWIGKRISAACDLIGTRTSAAQAIGISVDSLQRYIREERFPSLEVAAALSTIAGVRLEWLAFGTEPMKTSETAPQSHSQTARPPNAELELGVLSVAIRIAESVLKEAGIRDLLTADQFADFTKLAFDELARGNAEKETGALLARILKIGREPQKA